MWSALVGLPCWSVACAFALLLVSVLVRMLELVLVWTLSVLVPALPARSAFVFLFLHLTALLGALPVLLLPLLPVLDWAVIFT